jgi:shikimate 5-dehydrogenase/shikimate kinase
MLTVLVGHRGVGKSSLLERIPSYVPQALCFCLDSEIEKIHGPIKDIFSKQGEVAFRKIEESTFQNLLQKTRDLATPVFIAVGGGFQAEIPKTAKVLWIQRDWDVSKNIFFDRPSLNPDPNDLRIPPAIFQTREEHWERMGYDMLTLPEGVYKSHLGEEAYFRGQSAHGAITLLPQHFQGNRLEAIKDLKPNLVELRDDLLPTEQMFKAIDFFENKNVLLSFRNPDYEKQTSALVKKAALVDWPVERGEPPFPLPPDQRISSLHSEEENYYDALEFVEGFSEGRIKWSPFVKSFLQLRLGHEWQKRNPSQRIFLPRSENGRWYWYRHLQKQKMALNFFRFEWGSSLDQPTLLQWLQPVSTGFAAVLGLPVLQSWSPTFHANFFAQRNLNFYSIEVDEADLLDGGFEFLTELGLCYAAVTSPLKPWAGKLVGSPKPINTLFKNLQNSKWQGASTDEAGFQHLLHKNNLDLTEKTVAIWGGGGVLSALSLPKAVAYSARTGFPREGEPHLKDIDVLVWAAGWQNIETLPASWHPEVVLDLNYRADSPARVYAHKINAKYISGEDMFFKQAEEQQKIWSSHE